MHEIFLLVDFSVGLICFVMFKNRLHKDLYKKTQKQKKKGLKKYKSEENVSYYLFTRYTG